MYCLSSVQLLFKWNLSSRLGYRILLKLVVESLQNFIGSGGVVIAIDVLQLALPLVGALVVVVGHLLSQLAERPGEDGIVVIELFHRGTFRALGAKVNNSDPVGPPPVSGACLVEVVRENFGGSREVDGSYQSSQPSLYLMASNSTSDAMLSGMLVALRTPLGRLQYFSIIPSTTHR